MQKWINFESMLGQPRVITVLECADSKTIHVFKFTTAEPRHKEIY